MTRRYQDGGERLWTFGDDILVRCPSCAATAHVIADGTAPHRARLTCGACGLARAAAGAANGRGIASKAAKNRDAVVAGIARLRRRAGSSS